MDDAELAGRLLDHVRDGRSREAVELVTARMSPGDAEGGRQVTLALASVQGRIGQAWQRAELTIADEHAATAVVDDCLGLVAAYLPEPPVGRRVALVCAEGEWHVTPARMASLLLRAEGWHVTFLGGSTPPEHVHATLDLLRPDHVVVSCTLPTTLPGASRVAEAVHTLGLRVLGGGRAFGPDDRRARALGLDGWAPDIATAARILEQWRRVLPPLAVPPELDGEELTLELNEDGLVEAAMGRLGAKGRDAAGYDDRQRARAREDLAYILRFARVALVCDDERVMTDFLAWRQEALLARGVPVEAQRARLGLLAELADGLTRTQRLLRLAA